MDLASSGFEDFSRDIAAWNVRQRNADAWNALSLPQVEVVQRASADANERAAGSQRRIRRVLVPEDVGSAMLMEPDGFHDLTRTTSASSSNRRRGERPVATRFTMSN
jgi:hypothetical protein